MAAIEIQDARDRLPCRDARLVRPFITQPKSMGKGAERRAIHAFRQVISNFKG
ncbi:hypothetical protein [Segatella maculosa]|uniref:hypothetical protein n=1 Tax=Segatella maculosa TaxID=439703 RepID=UPI0003A88D92|nr:hypothetical protein [Segatella maculosa]